MSATVSEPGIYPSLHSETETWLEDMQELLRLLCFGPRVSYGVAPEPGNGAKPKVPTPKVKCAKPPNTCSKPSTKLITVNTKNLKV